MQFLNIFKIRFIRVNLLIFILFSMAMTLIAEKMPEKIYGFRLWLYRERKWESGGKVYERLFMVKAWKTRLPDISDFMKWRFNKKHFEHNDKGYLSIFLTESCKSELTHWMIIFSTVTFKLWNDWGSVLLLFLIASFLNLPYIIIQRYNRPRLIRLYYKNGLGEYHGNTANAFINQTFNK